MTVQFKNKTNSDKSIAQPESSHTSNIFSQFFILHFFFLPLHFSVYLNAPEHLSPVSNLRCETLLSTARQAVVTRGLCPESLKSDLQAHTVILRQPRAELRAPNHSLERHITICTSRKETKQSVAAYFQRNCLPKMESESCPHVQVYLNQLSTLLSSHMEIQRVQFNHSPELHT